MKQGIVAFVCAVSLLTVVNAASAAKCQDIPLRVVLYTEAVVDPPTEPVTTTPAALGPDSQGEYSANIMVCSGTFDAVTMVSGNRTFTFTFPAPLPGSVLGAAPPWVPGTFSVSGWINIRNILFNKGSNQPFATMAGSTFTRNGDRTQYHLGFKGYRLDMLNAPNIHDPNNTPEDNTPFTSSPVVVYPTYPTPCGPGAMPRWLVRATSPNTPGTDMEVATLHKKASGPRDTDVHAGQYSMPFEMTIEALKCFAY